MEKRQAIEAIKRLKLHMEKEIESIDWVYKLDTYCVEIRYKNLRYELIDNDKLL